jgi:hypothetical protein
LEHPCFEDIYTQNKLPNGAYGLEIEGGIRLNMPLPSGLVTAIFTYVENSIGVSNETETEFLTKQVNQAVGGSFI